MLKTYFLGCRIASMRVEDEGSGMTYQTLCSISKYPSIHHGWTPHSLRAISISLSIPYDYSVVGLHTQQDMLNKLHEGSKTWIYPPPSSIGRPWSCRDKHRTLPSLVVRIHAPLWTDGKWCAGSPTKSTNVGYSMVFRNWNGIYRIIWTWFEGHCEQKHHLGPFETKHSRRVPRIQRYNVGTLHSTSVRTALTIHRLFHFNPGMISRLATNWLLALRSNLDMFRFPAAKEWLRVR